MNMKIQENTIKTLRKGKGWSQQHLADVCNLNLRTIQRVESTHSCSLETLNALLSVFELSREDLEVSAEPEQCKKSDKTITSHVSLIKQINWRKNFGLIVLLFFLISYVAIYTIVVETAVSENMRIQWFGMGGGFSFGKEATMNEMTGMVIVPMFLYFNIILLSLLAFGIFRNSKVAAILSIVWVPFLYINNALEHWAVTPVTLFVSIILGVVMFITYSAIKQDHKIKMGLQ